MPVFVCDDCGWSSSRLTDENMIECRRCDGHAWLDGLQAQRESAKPEVFDFASGMDRDRSKQLQAMRRKEREHEGVGG